MSQVWRDFSSGAKEVWLATSYCKGGDFTIEIRWNDRRTHEFSERFGLPYRDGWHCQMTLRSDDDMQHAVSEIEALDRTGCLDHWRQVFGRSPPKHLSVPFLKRVLIWKLQCCALGGVSVKTQRALNRIAAGKPTQTTVKPGSQLVREWNGRTYQVDVVEGGFLMDGMAYPSLSAVAKRITGAHWSGPRFFGLT